MPQYMKLIIFEQLLWSYKNTKLTTDNGFIICFFLCLVSFIINCKFLYQVSSWWYIYKLIEKITIKYGGKYATNQLHCQNLLWVLIIYQKLLNTFGIETI